MKIRPDHLDQRVTFESETTTPNDRGGQANGVWAPITSTPEMWAHVETMPGSDSRQDDRVTNTYPVQITIRNREDIVETMRVVWRGRAYNIQAIEPYNARQEFRTISALGGVVQ